MRTLRASLAATKDLAIHLPAYAALRSTLDESLPEKAPPPWAPQPPYVSTMIFRPVKPASPYSKRSNRAVAEEVKRQAYIHTVRALTQSLLQHPYLYLM